MSAKRKLIADLLFGVQVLCTIAFGVAQFVRLLETTQGVSVSWYAFWEIFLVINLGLALRAHHAQRSAVTFQTILSYGLWVVMVGADIGVMLWRGSGTWDMRDTTTTIIASFGIICALSFSSWKKIPWSDPYVKGALALFFKAVPQFVMAWKIAVDGNGGLAGVTLLAGHITILTRGGQLAFSIKEAGWDRNRIGSAISEAGNELSWLVVTGVWLYVNGSAYEAAVMTTTALMMISAVGYVALLWMRKTQPTPATWILMATMMTLSFWMYWSSPTKTWTSNISVVTGYVNTLVILTGVIARNVCDKTLKLAFSPFQKGCLTAGALVVLLWTITRQPLLMYTFVQLIGLAAYAATAHRLWNADKSTEPPLFWFCILGANLSAIYPAIVRHDMFAAIYLTRVLPTTSGMIYLIWRAQRRMQTART